MKRSTERLLLILVAFLVVTSAMVAQENIPEPTQKTEVPYRLFRSQNIYTFLKLDTRTGQVWQVQWGTQPGYSWVQPINIKPLAQDGKLGRFTLYPSLNIYTFILLDQEDGRMWQVQWGNDKERVILPIV